MKLRIVTLLLAGLCCGMNLSAGAPRATFYLPFEESYAPLIAGGSRSYSGKAQSVPGRVGKGVRIQEIMCYANPDNISMQKGTVCFFYAPDVSPKTELDAYNRDKKNKPQVEVLFCAQHLRFFISGWSGVFMTGYFTEKPGQGLQFHWSYELNSTRLRLWTEPKKFHHIAITWDQTQGGQRILYYDGAEVARIRNLKMPKDINPKEFIQIGKKNVRGVIDEVIIYDRPLTAAQVKFHAEHPDAVAKALHEAAGKKAASVSAGKIAASSFRLGFETAAPQYQQTAGVLGKGGTKVSVLTDKAPTDFLTEEAGSVSMYYTPAKKPARNGTLFRAGKLALEMPSGYGPFISFRNAGEPAKQIPSHRIVIRASTRWTSADTIHLVLTYRKKDGKLVKNIYINGTPLEEETTPAPSSLFTASDRISFGDGSDAVLDEICCFKKALTEAEVLQLAGFPVEAAKAAGCAAPGTLKELPLTYEARDNYAKILKVNPLDFEYVLWRDMAKSVANPNEPVNLEVRPRNRSVTPFSGKVRFVLRDFDLNSLMEFQREIKLAPGDKTVLFFPVKAAKRGPYRLDAEWTVNGKKYTKSVSSFVVWDKRKPQAEDTFFGYHVQSGYKACLEQAHRLGQLHLRDHDMTQITWWFRVQPEPGPFRWTLEDQMKMLRHYKMRLLGTIFTTPYWARADGKGVKNTRGYNDCRQPKLDAFEKYVYETVTHYKNDIRNWEFWNEPEVSMFWKGTPEEFANQEQIALKAAKRADPTCKFFAAGHSMSSWAWHERAAKAGLYKGVDGITFHFTAGLTNTQTEVQDFKLHELVEHFQSLAVKYGDGKRLTLWNTEGGTGCDSFFENVELPQLPPLGKRQIYSWRHAAFVHVKGVAIQMKYGVTRHYIYFQTQLPLNSTATYNCGTLDINWAPRPFLMSRLAMQEQIDFTDYAGEHRRRDASRFWAHVWKKRNAKECVVMLYCGENGKAEVDVKFPGRILSATDLFGNALPLPSGKLAVEEKPFYLTVAGEPKAVLDALAEAKVKVIAAADKEIDVMTENAKAEKCPVGYQPDFVTPLESPNTIFTVNLRPFCNMGFRDDKAGDGVGGWADEGDLNDLRDMPVGKRTFFNVPFDIIDPAKNHGKSIITLRGTRVTEKFPSEVKDVPVGKKAWKLYFLHCASWGVDGDMADYIVKYTDGTSVTIPINIPRNCANWWFYTPNKLEQAKVLPIRVTSNSPSGKPEWRYLRIFEWENPHREKTIESLTFRSRGGYQTPIILAVTGV